MRRSTLTTVVIAGSLTLAGIVPCFAATAANSQNGTQNSGAATQQPAGATPMAPDAGAPATAMPNGAGTGTGMESGGNAGTGTAPGAGMGGAAGTGGGTSK